MARSRRIPFAVPLIVAIVCLLVIQYFTSASDRHHSEITKFGIDGFSFVPGTVLRMDSRFPITEAGASGAGVTWDFSRHTFSTQELTLTAQDMANFPEAERFPGATALYVRSLPDGTTSYSFFDHKEGFTGHGEMFTAGEHEMFKPYLDPLTWFTTPITYRGKGSDNFAYSSSEHGRESNTTGIISWKADAYGTLILPNATYTDVLRIHAQQVETLSVDIGVPFEMVSSREEWRWMKAGIPFPLLVFSLETDEFETAIGATAAMVSYNGATSIAEQAQLPMRVYPNPAREHVTMELEANGAVQYRVLDALGREVMNGSTAADGMLRHNIDLAPLSSGVYHLEVRNQEGIATARLVKE